MNEFEMEKYKLEQILFYITTDILEERNLKLKELKIDPELRDLLPSLTDEAYLLIHILKEKRFLIQATKKLRILLCQAK